MAVWPSRRRPASPTWVKSADHWISSAIPVALRLANDPRGDTLTPSTDSLLSTVGSIYDAGTDARRWPEALDCMRALTTTPVAALSLSLADRMVEVHVSGADPDLLGRMQDMTDENLWLRRAHRAVPGRVINGEELASSDEVRRSRVYDEILRPAGVLHICGAIFMHQRSLIGTLIVLRSESLGPFGSETGAVFDQIIPHVTRATKLNALLADVDLYAAGLEAAADRLQFGLMLLDEAGRLLFANNAAEAMLAAGTFRRDLDGRLTASSRSRAFATMLRHVSQDGVAAALAMPRSGAEHLRLVAAPLPPRRREFSTAARAGRIALFVFDGPGNPTPMDLLAGVYGLTHAEARLAAALAAGKSLQQYADQTRHSRNTVKSQLSAIFRKTGVSRQSDLIRLRAQISAVDTSDR